MTEDSNTPIGKLTTRTLTMPADTNPAGDIFGGWVLAQMDIAGGICAAQRAQSRVVTVTLDSMTFIRPVQVGDILGVYTKVVDVGRTSMVVHVEAWVRRNLFDSREKVTEGHFKFVALDDKGNSRVIPSEEDLPDYMDDDL